MKTSRLWGILLGSSPRAMALVLAVATLTRSFRLLAHGFWYDEAYLYLEILHLWDALKGLGVYQPPLFDFLIKPVTLILPAEAALKVPSALFGILACGVILRIGEDLFGEVRIGLAGALVAAVSPFLIFYSQQGRYYTLYLLLAALALWSFLRILEAARPERWAWLFYGLAHLLLVYTHTYGNVLVLGELVTLLLLRRLLRRVGRRWMVWQVGIGVSQLPLLALVLMMVRSVTKAEKFWVPTLTWSTVRQTLRYLAVGYYADGWAAALGTGLVLLLGIGGLLLCRCRRRVLAILLPSLLVLPTVMAGVSLLIQPIYLERSLVPVTIPFYLLVGLPLSRLRLRWMGGAVLGAWLLLLTPALQAQYSNYLMPPTSQRVCPRLEAKRAARELAPLLRPGDRILHSTIFGLLPFLIHLPPREGIEQFYGILEPGGRYEPYSSIHYPEDLADRLYRRMGIEFYEVGDVGLTEERIWLVLADANVAEPLGWFSRKLLAGVEEYRQPTLRLPYQGLEIRLYPAPETLTLATPIPARTETDHDPNRP